MSKHDERAARLAEALRANLKRRKMQAREGAAQSADSRRDVFDSQRQDD